MESTSSAQIKTGASVRGGGSALLTNRGRLINVILAAISLVAVVILVRFIFDAADGLVGIAQDDLLLYARAPAVAVMIAVVFFINRAGRVVSAGRLLVVLTILIISFTGGPRSVVNGSGLFLFSLPITLASLIIMPRASFTAAALSALMIYGVSLRAGVSLNSITVIGFFLLAFFSWLSSSQIENALHEAEEANGRLRKYGAELKETRNLFRNLSEEQKLLLDTVPAMIWHKDTDGNLLQVNEAAARYVGMKVEDMVGKNDYDLFPVDADKYRKDDLEVINTGKPRLGLIERVQHVSGERKWIKTDTIPYLDERGKVTGLVQFSLDINEKVNAEDALYKSEELLHAFIHNSTTVIYIKGVRGQYLLVNKIYEELFHVTESEMIGKTDYDLFPAGMADVLKENDRKVMEEKKTLVVDEIVPHDDGDHYYVSIKFPLYDTEGEIYGVCGISTDVSERRRAEKELDRYRERLEELVEERTLELKETHEKLVASEKLAVLGQFSGSIAHEIRNPLGVISGLAFFLKRKAKEENSDSIQYLDKIVKQISRVTDIIDSILRLTRVEPLLMKTLGLEEALRAAIDASKLPPGVAVEWNAPEREILVEIDAENFQIVVRNISRNAAQAMDEKGTLTIDLDTVQENSLEWATVRFTDTGPGIEEENLDKIFVPTYTTKIFGIGFGLAIVKMIVERHNGTISVSSKPGEGAAFTIRLPIKPVERT